MVRKQYQNNIEMREHTWLEKIWYIKYWYNCLAEGHVGGQLSFLNPWFKSGRPELTKNLITINDLVLSAQVWLLAGNCPKEVWAHVHTQSSWLPGLPDCLLLNRSRWVWNIFLMATHQLRIQDWELFLNGVEKELSSCIHSLAFPFARAFTRETTKDSKAPPFAWVLLHGCILIWRWKSSCPLQGPLSLSQVPAPFQSSSNIINSPAFLDINKITIATHSYGCCRILFPRSYFHFCRNICILSQNFPRLLYAWGKILFCLFEGLIKCCTARGLEQGDKRKRMWLFFIAKIVETSFELSL